MASLPAVAPDTARVMELIGDVWPQAAATDTVWTTVLTSYDAIEGRSRSQPSAHVAAGTILTNVRGCLRSNRPADHALAAPAPHFTGPVGPARPPAPGRCAICFE